MSDEQFDPLEVSAELGGTTNPTVEEVARSAAFEVAQPDTDVTDAEADEAELLEEGELSEDVPGPDADGESVTESP